MAAQVFDDGKAPGEEDLGWFGEAAARWAGDGLPLSAVLRACQAGLRTALESATARTAAGNAGEVLDATDLMLELLRTVTAVVCDAYVDEDRHLARERHASAHTLASALLSGQAGSAVARHAGLPIAESYQVVALSAPAHPDDRDDRYDAPTTAGRALRRLHSAVSVVFGAQVPALLSPTGGTLLLPRGGGTQLPRGGGTQLPRGGDGPELTAELTAELLAELSAAAEIALSAAAVLAEAGQVPEAAEQAHELLEVARVAGRGPGFYRLADLAMEYQLTRGGPAGRQLARLFDPLDAHPELFDTARAYLRNDMNRRRTARQLFVHPNTVDYRLRRIVQLTGMDLATATGIARATAALLARDLDRAGPRGRATAPDAVSCWSPARGSEMLEPP
ncbi:PucR family transcriptional regulator [Nocardia shimofusensis]|uniref:PucR family transcriptional regulator n=1 Tax=Nocardia shimofusensis TaxID=228596 RepID=UPI001FDFC802|nr:helix-turn-helix domain-containing protein [Nocardia shimofusensis]